MFRVEGLGSRVVIRGLGFKVWCFGLRGRGVVFSGEEVWLKDLRFRVQGLGFKVWGLESRVSNSGFWVQVLDL